MDWDRGSVHGCRLGAISSWHRVCLPPVLPEPWEPPPHSAVPWVLSEVHHKHAEPQLSVQLGWGLCWETVGSSRVSMTCFCSLRPGMRPPTPALQKSIQNLGDVAGAAEQGAQWGEPRGELGTCPSPGFGASLCHTLSSPQAFWAIRWKVYLQCDPGDHFHEPAWELTKIQVP